MFRPAAGGAAPRNPLRRNRSVPFRGATAVAGSRAASRRGSPARQSLPAVAAHLGRPLRVRRPPGYPSSRSCNSFSGQEPLDGWESGVAPAAALAALLLVALSAVAFARPELSTRLPLGRVALVTAYFGIAVAADSRSRGRFLVGAAESAADVEFAYGAYIGLGAVAAMLLATVVLRRAEFQLLLRSPLAVAAMILAAGLLLVFLLPWRRFMGIRVHGNLRAGGPGRRRHGHLHTEGPARPWATRRALYCGCFQHRAVPVRAHPKARGSGSGSALTLAALAADRRDLTTGVGANPVVAARARRRPGSCSWPASSFPGRSSAIPRERSRLGGASR